MLAVQHEDGCPPDRLGTWLGEAGVHLEVLRPDRGDAVPERVGHDGLLVLGGRMGAHDDDVAPWLPATRALLASAVADGTPTLGVCLGAQLLAVACGGRVEVGAAGIEAGVVDVRWRDEATGDPLLDPVAATGPGPSMHLDAVVALPPGARRLGETAQYPHQAFRVGAAAWGVQYHPEVSPGTWAGWVDGHRDDWPRWRRDGAEIVAVLSRRDEEVVAAGRRLAARFAAVLGAGPSSAAEGPGRGAGRCVPVPAGSVTRS